MEVTPFIRQVNAATITSKLATRKTPAAVAAHLLFLVTDTRPSGLGALQEKYTRIFECSAQCNPSPGAAARRWWLVEADRF